MFYGYRFLMVFGFIFINYFSLASAGEKNSVAMQKKMNFLYQKLAESPLIFDTANCVKVERVSVYQISSGKIGFDLPLPRKRCLDPASLSLFEKLASYYAFLSGNPETRCAQIKNLGGGFLVVACGAPHLVGVHGDGVASKKIEKHFKDLLNRPINIAVMNQKVAEMSRSGAKHRVLLKQEGLHAVSAKIISEDKSPTTHFTSEFHYHSLMGNQLSNQLSWSDWFYQNEIYNLSWVGSPELKQNALSFSLSMPIGPFEWSSQFERQVNKQKNAYRFGTIVSQMNLIGTTQNFASTLSYSWPEQGNDRHRIGLKHESSWHESELKVASLESKQKAPVQQVVSLVLDGALMWERWRLSYEGSLSKGFNHYEASWLELQTALSGYIDFYNHDFLSQSKIEFLYSEDNLPPSKEFSLLGKSRVRGLSRPMSHNRGALFSQSIFLPTNPLLGGLFQAGTFIDAGWLERQQGLQLGGGLLLTQSYHSLGSLSSEIAFDLNHLDAGPVFSLVWRKAFSF